MNAHTKIKPKVLNLYGVIGLDIISDDLRFELANLSKETPLHINLNSAGGSALEGFEARQLLLDWPGHVTIEVKSIAASAATVIATAGDYVTINNGALFMIHEPSSLSFGTAEDHQKSINMLNGVGGSAVDVYHQKSGLSKKQCRKLMLDETWMTAPETVKMGFADDVKGESNQKPPKFDYAAFQNAPTALMAYQENFPFENLADEKRKETMTKPNKKPAAPPTVNTDVTLSGAGLWTELNDYRLAPVGLSECFAMY